MGAYSREREEMEKCCDVIVYRSRWWPGSREWAIDCEQHEISYGSVFFFDAIAEAMIHRSEVGR